MSRKLNCPACGNMVELHEAIGANPLFARDVALPFRYRRTSLPMRPHRRLCRRACPRLPNREGSRHLPKADESAWPSPP